MTPALRYILFGRDSALNCFLKYGWTSQLAGNMQHPILLGTNSTKSLMLHHLHIPSG